MEGTQEISSKPLTKSSRKRQRKKQAAALEKFILASEAAGSCKIEPLQDPSLESVEIKGCLSNIVFHTNSLGEKEFFVSNNSPLDVKNTLKSVCCEGHETLLVEKDQEIKKAAANTKLKSVCCEGHETLLVEKDQDIKRAAINTKLKNVCCEGHESLLVEKDQDIKRAATNTKLKSVCCEGHEDILFEKDQDTKKESVVHHSKRRRNGKNAPVLEVSSNNPDATVVAKSQRSVNTQSSQHHGTSQRDLTKQALSSLNQTVAKTPVVASTKDTKKFKESNKLSDVTDSKQEEETGDKVPTLSRSKKRRNRKKALTTSELSSDSQDQCVDGKGIKSREIPECSPQLIAEHSSLQKNHAPGQRLDPNLSSAINSERPACEVKSHPIKNNLVFKSEETSVGNIGRATDKKGEKSQVSILPEKFDDISQETCDLNCQSPGEKNKGISVKLSEVNKGSLNLEKEGNVTVAPELSVIESKLLEALAKSDSCGSECQKEPSQALLADQKTSEFLSTIFCVTSENHPTDMEGAQKNIPQAGLACEEISGKNKAKAKGKLVQDSPVSRKAGPVQNEADRQSDPKSVTKIPSQGDSVSERESVSKDVDNLKENSVVNKMSSPARCVVPASSEVMVKLAACMDSVRIDDKSETPKGGEHSSTASTVVTDKSKDKIKAEREARKAAKMAKKHKENAPSVNKDATETPATPTLAAVGHDSTEKKSVELTEEKAKILPHQIPQEEEKTSAGESKAELRAKRRAKQEAQRAAKAAATLNQTAPSQEKAKNVVQDASKPTLLKGGKPKQKSPASKLKKPREKVEAQLLSRLGCGDGQVKRSTSEDTTLEETRAIHPAIVQLSTRFTDRIISGSNARCLAFVQAIKKAIVDYQTPPQKELGRDLEARLLTPSLAYLESQRPHAISVLNATKFLKWQLTQLQPVQECSIENSSLPHLESKKAAVIPDENAKKSLIELLDSYTHEKIELAEQAVCNTLRDKIKDDDVILTYGCSYLLQQILTGAKKSGTKFKVVVVDGRPWREGREMLRCLVAVGIPCSYVLLSAASSVMRQVNKVLLGAHALLSNGYVMSRVGVSQVALLANAHNVPVLVACETHKFCERVQSDSFVYNEMGEPDGLAQLLGGEDGPLSDWRSIHNLTLLNLSYDVTPPELVTAVATELAVLPCTSVPVVLRVRPTEPITFRH
ncbi:uncharacterized protein eIF2Bdelta [Hetaerina americana]|uniref:uncharacterized protein eIF2Bdelta n=1 Tax=Hetaerina americana TaxID=62018 RepID=UPI003A7F5B45